MKIVTVIPTYKNDHMLVKNMHINMPYLNSTHIVVVNDDPSSPRLGTMLHELFPPITTIQQVKNRGFPGAMNTGMAFLKSDYALFLNNDVILMDTSWEKAIDQLEKDPSIFAVSFAQREKSDSLVGANTGKWESGFFNHSASPVQSTHFNAWPEGGSCVVRTKIFNQLAGYDERFSPFYWEDVDLGYRAWKCGYYVIFNKEIIVEHHHETTIKSTYSRDDIATIASRNQFYFVWKNADSLNVRAHFSHLPHMLASQSKKNKPFLKGFLRALPHLPEFLIARHKQSKNWVNTDGEVIKKFHG